ncbi:TM2 domain-containing protein [Nocardioides sp.]|uniref:TM2 domain-containing protein n=1 Tax=Nocardioides sp. TaxID=35761 RepID=UPI002382FFAC|nr:TM2 domain-containing protein [Nocardioides sp.]MDE0777400.1 TM2 domain-containing protein [Nocardioides sp.]
MSNPPHDPYGTPGTPEEPREPGEPGETGPVWGSSASYEQYHPGQAYPPPPAAYGYPPPPAGSTGYPAVPYGYGASPGPYGRGVSDKSKTTAGLLQLLLPFVGVCGVGRLYAGHLGIGLTQLIGLFASFCLSAAFIGIPFLIGIWLWSVIDGIVMLAGSQSLDGQGRPMRS